MGDVYESLLRQTSRDFVWLIVDDGSTDDTREMVERWQQENTLSIHYHYQENGGKMRAHNVGAQLCDTELFVCLDSDDQLTDTAVEEILTFWTEHKNDRRDVMGLIAPKLIVDDHGIVVRRPQMPVGLAFTTGRGLYEHGYSGETAMVFVTEILRRYPFPVQEGESFISEISAYDAMDEHYVMLTYDNPLMICQYRQDGYTTNQLEVNVRNPKGVVYVNQQRQRQKGRFSPTLMREYIVYSLIANYAMRKIIEDSVYPLCCLLMFPWGYAEKSRIMKQLKRT